MTTQPSLPPLSEEMARLQRRAIRRRRLNRALTYALAFLLVAWILVPLYLIASMAFSTVDAVRAYPKSAFPNPISFETMRFFLNSQGVVDSTIRSILVALITVVFSTIVATPAGYAISRYMFRGRDMFKLSILAVRAFPIVVLAVPLAVMFIQFRMRDQLYSLALVHTALTLPTTILVMSSVFASVPRELEEAAHVFGSTPIRAFLRVVLPLAAPGIAASAIFTFVTSWNEVFAAVILTIRNRTLPAQVLTVLGTSPLEYKFAGAFFMLVPSMIFIFFIRKYLFNMWGQITK
jgi:multiple sugar transport system permease protein